MIQSQTFKDYEQFFTDNSNIELSYFDSISVESPYYGYILSMKAYYLLRKNDSVEADLIIERLDSKIDNDSPYLDYYYMIKALSHIIKEDRDEANKNFELALQYDKSSDNKWLRLELFFFFLEHEDYKAFGYLDESLKIDPNFNEAIIEKSLYLDSDQQCKQVIENLEKVPTTYHSSKLLNLLGVSYYNCGFVDKGIKTLEKSINANSNTDNNYYLGCIYHDHFKDFDLAEKYLRESLVHNESNTDSINALAWLFYDKQEYLEAENLFLKLLNFNSDQAVYDQIIQFYLHRKNLKKASIYIQKSKDVNGYNFTNEGFEIALMFLNKIDYKKALKSYKDRYGDFEYNWLYEFITHAGASL